MPNPHAAAVEQVIRDLITDNPDLPIRADFYRGATGRTGPLDEWTRYEHAETPGCPHEWFVRIKPAAFDVCVSAAGRYEWGVHDVIGEVAVVELPQTSPGVVDVDALTGSRFHVELLAAVREKAAVVAEMRANITA